MLSCTNECTSIDLCENESEQKKKKENSAVGANIDHFVLSLMDTVKPKIIHTHAILDYS